MHRSRITSYTMLHTCSKFIQTKKQEFGSNMKQPSNLLTSSNQPIFVLPESSLDLHPSPPHLWRALKNVKRPSCPVNQWSCGRESWTSTEGRFLVPWIEGKLCRENLSLGFAVNQQAILPGIENHQTTQLPSVDLRIKRDWMGMFQLGEGWALPETADPNPVSLMAGYIMLHLLACFCRA